MLVGVVAGSESDWGVMQWATHTLTALEVPYEARVLSAHRTPEAMFGYAAGASGRLDAIIAGAGGAAHLPGMLASRTLVPVLGVPVPGEHLQGLDSLLSIVQMPGGVPVPTLAIGKAGAVNAALFVARMLALRDQPLRQRLGEYVERMARASLDTKLEVPA